MGEFHYVNGQAEPAAECRRLGDLIRQCPIDVALVGIGENGHLAFNDPPADFQTEEPYRAVELDEACRRQQWGEGWFPTLDAVPRQAISMSIRQIMKSRAILCSVPDRRKAPAVRAVLEGPVTPQVPASSSSDTSTLRCNLDPPSASLLERRAVMASEESVAFRSAKDAAFAERKATLIDSPVPSAPSATGILFQLSRQR